MYNGLINGLFVSASYFRYAFKHILRNVWGNIISLSAVSKLGVYVLYVKFNAG